MDNSHILVLGSGSVGKRHLKNFYDLGCRVSAMDPQKSRLSEAEEIVPLQNQYVSLDEALNCQDTIHGVVVCSPPSYHVAQTKAMLKKNIPVLLEKPVSPDQRSCAELCDLQSSTQVPLLLGYTFRWWPPIQRVKAILEDETLGRIYSVQMIMSAHLADWHPWERYQDFFMSQMNLGGGALLDESHFLDLAIWFFGMPQEVTAQIDRLSSLEIDSDDNVDMNLSYADKKKVMIHLDLYGRPHEKCITFTGEKGALKWSVDPNQVKLYLTEYGKWQIEEFNCERNDMFLEEAKDFLQMLSGVKNNWCTIQDGLNVLKVIEAARVSHAEKKTVEVVCE